MPRVVEADAREGGPVTPRTPDLPEVPTAHRAPLAMDHQAIVAGAVDLEVAGELVDGNRREGGIVR